MHDFIALQVVFQNVARVHVNQVFKHIRNTFHPPIFYDKLRDNKNETSLA